MGDRVSTYSTKCTKREASEPVTGCRGNSRFGFKSLKSSAFGNNSSNSSTAYRSDTSWGQIESGEPDFCLQVLSQMRRHASTAWF